MDSLKALDPERPIREADIVTLHADIARRLLAEANGQGMVMKTHQQLAQDLGSVREVISRYLREWERMGWVRSFRGTIELIDRPALTSYGGGEA